MRFTLPILLILIVALSGFWNEWSPWISAHMSSWGLYNIKFLEEFLTGIHGSIFDLFIVGVIIYWFDKRREKKDSINKSKEKIEMLRYYRGSDAAFITYDALKHFLSFGDNKIDIPESNLSNLKINNLELRDSNLIAINLSASKIKNIKLVRCNLEAAQFIDSDFKGTEFETVNFKRSKFINAQLKGVDFSTCDIRGVNFSNANLQSAIFKNVDCSKINLKGTDLRSANFIGAKNLTRGMILEARNYAYIKLPSDITI